MIVESRPQQVNEEPNNGADGGSSFLAEPSADPTVDPAIDAQRKTMPIQYQLYRAGKIPFEQVKPGKFSAEIIRNTLQDSD